jgi:hypothetical protein
MGLNHSESIFKMGFFNLEFNNKVFFIEISFISDFFRLSCTKLIYSNRLKLSK